jgi:hypothetical protein
MLKLAYFTRKRLQFQKFIIHLQRFHVKIKFFHSLRFRKDKGGKPSFSFIYTTSVNSKHFNSSKSSWD